MNSTNKRVHRVMVVLTDATRKGMTTSSCSGEDNPHETEMKILDSRSLLLRIQNTKANAHRTELGADGESPRYYRHMEFDSIGYEYEPQVRGELSELIEQTFRQQTHGCLLRMTPLRTHNLNLLTRLLVAEVDKAMLVLHCRLRAINVDYYDVRKFDMVNMLSEASPNKRHLHFKHCGRCLQSTRELFQWLVTEYNVLRTRGSGDDFIDLQYIFRDGQQKLHKLHLTIFQIFGCDERMDISGFFNGLPMGRNNHASLLTDCIKESFDFKKPMRTVILFELPLTVGKEAPKWMRKILRLADTAYTSIATSYKNVGDCSITPFRVSSKGNLSASGSFSLSPSSSRSLGSISNSLRRRAAKMSTDDYNSLVYWYGRIDSKFKELQLSMEDHFKSLYNQKSLQIFSNLKCMSNDVSQEDDYDDESGGDATEHLPNQSHIITASRYQELLKQFRHLENEAAKSCFASTLMVYMSTKNYELNEAMKALKQREIEKLRQTLIKYIKNDPTICA
ncbi:uncharacterized protein Dwil_GK22422 [Drosophila willistoni]|uniref:Uncharacterized protein n=1 Tax=Drosophila willistoni TaxID=7260 RepID=B4NG36_DROWI|nr:uncharacterized protein Dwil_GK22422 [Drosophila willistoni]